MQLDGSCASIIDTFRVYAQDGTELERIQEYSLIDSVLGQYAGDLETDNLLAGAPPRRSDFPSFGPVTSGAAALAATADTKEHGLKIVSTFTGQTGQLSVESRGGCGYDQLQSDKLNHGVIKHYEMGFRASGWFNPSMNRLLPPNCSFVVELQLNTAVKAFLRTVGTDAIKYIVNNTYLNIPAVTVNDPVCLQHLQDKMAMGISWSAQTYSHHVNTTQGTQDTVQINARVFDLNGLITILRQQTNISQADKMGISKRSIQGITQYQYTLGSTQYPPQPIKITLPEDAEIAAGVQAITATASSNVSQSFSELKRVLKHIKGARTRKRVPREFWPIGYQRWLRSTISRRSRL